MTTRIIINVAVMLLAVGVTVGIPALFPTENIKKYYFRSCALAEAGAYILLFAHEFGNNILLYFSSLMVVIIISKLGALLEVFNSKNYKDRTSLAGGIAGGISGIVLYFVVQTVKVPLQSALAVKSLTKETVPAMIIIIVYCGINWLWHFIFFKKYLHG